MNIVMLLLVVVLVDISSDESSCVGTIEICAGKGGEPSCVPCIIHRLSLWD